MKSVIDWNEIVPVLPKQLRETLMLEAVMLLSSGKHNSAPQPFRETRRRIAPKDETKLDRQWLAQGDGRVLSSIGRRYRINKDAKRPPGRGKIGAVWKKLIESKNDVIAYEGIASICKGEKATPSATICQLWERRFIEVEEKKVAVAY